MSALTCKGLELSLGDERVVRVPSAAFPGSDYETVDTYSNLCVTTADRVHVLDISDGPFGLRGDCWFEKTDLPWTEGQHSHSSAYVHRRSDGAVMTASPDQAPAPIANAPVVSLGDCIASYVLPHSKLVYGNDGGLFHLICENKIDCSMFVNAVLDGITYANSRYSRGTEAENLYGAYMGDNYLPERTDQINPRRHALGAIRMAEWFAQQKRLFKFKATGDYREDLHRLRFGDVLFYGVPDPEGDYADAAYFISHCMIVLRVFDDGHILVAQGGGDGIGDGSVRHYQKSSDFEGSVPTCKLSVFDFKTYVGTRCQVFARPNYGGAPERPELLPVTVNRDPGARDGEYRRIARIKADAALIPGCAYTLILKGTLPTGDANSLALRMTHQDSHIQWVADTYGVQLRDTAVIPFVFAPAGRDGNGIIIYDRMTGEAETAPFRIDSAALVRGFAETAELTDAIAITEAESYADVIAQLKLQVLDAMPDFETRRGRMLVSISGSGETVEWKIVRRSAGRCSIGVIGSGGAGARRECVNGTASDTAYTAANPIPFEYVY